MKTFKDQAAQGDFLITRIESLPDHLVKQDDEKGNYIIAHSETGHNHVMKSEDVDFYQSANDEFVAYLHVKKETDIVHLRSFDTHSPITVPPGLYRINRQREYTPEGYRRAQD